MKLYYAPGACSLASHIALLEAGIDFDLDRVDLKRKLTASGQDFNVINGKGYVPALVLDDGEMITENIAVLDWIASQFPPLGIDDVYGRTRLLETLAYISTELHKTFKPFWVGASEEDKAKAETYLIKRFHWLANRTQGHYLFGDTPTVADFYLLVTTRWAGRFGVALPQALVEWEKRLLARPNVRAAIDFEESPLQRTGSV
jgi:glutathione S-transferase